MPTFADRLRSVAAEFGKFAVVGGFCFVLDTVLAYILRFKLGDNNLGPNTAKGLATIVAVGFSYAGNRLWSFAHRVDEDSSHGQDMTRYAVINGIGLVITLIPVSIAHYILSQESVLAFTLSGIIGTGIATLFRFWSYRRFVFNGATDPAERAALV